MMKSHKLMLVIAIAATIWYHMKKQKKDEPA